MQAVKAIPSQARARQDRVLIEGAATGHRHEIAAGDEALLYELEGEVFLRVRGAKARIVHCEHDTIELAEGCYRIWRQREYRGAGMSAPVLD